MNLKYDSILYIKSCVSTTKIAQQTLWLGSETRAKKSVKNCSSSNVHLRLVSIASFPVQDNCTEGTCRCYYSSSG